MKNLKSLLAAVVLTVAFSGATFAGETLTPPCAPGETLTPPCSSAPSSDGSPVETTTPSGDAGYISLAEIAIESVLLFY